ncbi:MAG: hypothetical protein ACI93R_004108 [Flavobacteriales bacterium]|jgi:hypothetical protein
MARPANTLSVEVCPIDTFREGPSFIVIRHLAKMYMAWGNIVNQCVKGVALTESPCQREA